MKQVSHVFYIEVADVEGGYFMPSPEYPLLLATQELAERAAEESLNRYAVARVCQEVVVYRREQK